MTGADRRTLAAMALVVAGLHVAGVLLGLAVLASAPALISTCVLAYTLGLRHGFDADHLLAIDTTTRRLRGRGSPSVGLWFSLGHCTVVLALSVALGLAAAAVTRHLDGWARVGGVIGMSVSGTFLWAIGITNLVLLVAGGVRGHRDGPAPTPVGRLLARPLARVARAQNMYVVGLLFGLGLDTAVEIGLLTLSASGATGVPRLAAVLAPPLLFAAGMTFVDSLDGVVMRQAYGWATARPERRESYNLAITSLTAVFALGVGSLQLLAAAGLRVGEALDLQTAGFAVAATLLACWAIAAVALRNHPRRGTAGRSGRLRA